MDKDLRIMPADSYTSSWQLDGTVNYVSLEGGSMRDPDIGQGAPLLLIHTLRTQIDYFQKLIPLLQDRYRILVIACQGMAIHRSRPMLVLMNRSFGNTSSNLFKS